MKDVKFMPWIILAITVIVFFATSWQTIKAISTFEKVGAIGFLLATVWLLSIAVRGTFASKQLDGSARGGLILAAVGSLGISICFALGIL